jgi:hypothetical protein
VGVDLGKQTPEQALAKSVSCMECHKNQHDPHYKDTVKLGCTDCHGGDATTTDINRSHVQAKYPAFWPTSANPVRSFSLLNHESPEFIRFVNPGDFRIAHISCGLGGCHAQEVQVNRKSMMVHGAMLWGAALYNNGSVPYKRARHGEAYSMHGAPVRLKSNPPPDQWEMEKKGVVPFIDPLPRYEMSQPGNILRIFERGGRFPAQEIGNPERTEESGRPRARLSDRGIGTKNRTDPVFVSLNKTRLFDPTLNFLGTNDHPGDYRSSGCTACHVIYANDRSPVHSGPYAKFGNKGMTAQLDPTIKKDERGHPIEHKFTNSIPTSQCIICHIHPGTTVMQSYIGYLWWDEETHAELVYPKHQREIKSEQWVREVIKNPNESAMRNNLSNDEFLDELAPNLNPKMTKTQFADFHGHGWAYRAIFKKDLDGNIIDYFGNKVKVQDPKQMMASINFPCMVKNFHLNVPGETTPQQSKDLENEFQKSRENLPVHLLDIHMEKGMHCVDCHFVQDMHGNNRLQLEVRAAVEIQCIDCHGTSADYTTLLTTGPASYTSAKDGKGRNLSAMRTPFGKPRFEQQELADGTKRFFQNSCVEPGLRWEIVQTKDTITPGHPRYNEKSHVSKTVRWEGDSDKPVWGDFPVNADGSPNKKGCAHDDSKMTCITCHSSWNPSCYGCHLPQRANVKMAHNHWDGDVSRNYTPYNFQTLRDEVFMIGKDGDATGNRINPTRSSCAIHVGSYNGNRESIYVQQQTISGEGLSGIAFSANVPHTVRGSGVRETKQCTDCHLSKDNDNNALMAQLLMHGTNYLNFVGRFAWIATGEEGIQAVIVTERDEPQTVIGSTFHEIAFPKNYEEFVHEGRKLEAWEHPGRDVGDGVRRPFKKNEVYSIQNRGEYAYCACGEDGVRIFDIAFIDDKAFAERITTAPVSPIGQKFYVKTKNARYVAAPATTAPDPTRIHFPENKEQAVSPVFAFIYVADAEEGLVMINAATLLDGNPLNNYLRKDVAFNPEGKLTGANFVEVVGNYAYVCCDKGLAVVDLSKALEGKLEITKIVGEEESIHHPHCVRVQFRYAYVVDEEGVKVLDVTDLAKPVTKSKLRIPHCHSIYLARTYAYLAAGPRGMVILDIKHPEEPKIDQVYNAGGCMNDTHDIKLGITYNSEFAYVADGKNGFRVVQLTSTDTPGYEGFSVRPTPNLIGTFKIPFGGHALNVAEGVDRDRAVDESGNAMSVFGRVGARAFNKEEQERLYLHNKKPWFVSNDPKWGGFEKRTKK